MKICSLLPSGTEILFELGLGDSIVGVTDLCDYPEAVTNKRIVSRSKIDVGILTSEEVESEMHRMLDSDEPLFELDQDLLTQINPDVILTQDLCYFCEIDATVVRESVAGMPGIPDVLTLNPRTVAEVLQTIMDVGRCCDAFTAAESLVSQLNQRVAFVKDRLLSVSNRPRAFSIEGVNPLVVGGHWIPDLFSIAGAASGPYTAGCDAERIDFEEIVKYKPEKLFIDLCSSDLERQFRELPWLINQDGWKNLPAVRTGEVYLIDHVYFSRPGPRIIKGLEILAELMHPEYFSGMVPPGVVAKLRSDYLMSGWDGPITEMFQTY
ncbi:MAG: ABC transporter substrate-binding protein [Chloroflexota bacterium]|nr:ABC transporter substrate-binding protein [Chloroflexota bacterium]